MHGSFGQVLSAPVDIFSINAWGSLLTSMCTEKNRSDAIAAILERIPNSDEDARSLRSLCPFAKHTALCEGCLQALLTILRMFDAIKVISGSDKEEARVKARSETGGYFFKSLAAYLRRHLTLVSNWEREGIEEDATANQTLDLGAQFLYLMEHKRTFEFKDTSPIREVFVSQVIIKAKIRARQEPTYLMQYDEKARWLQLIGGRKRSKDVDALTVMIREIEEELAQNHLKFNRDYELRELIPDIQHFALSPTFGAYTRYHFAIYQAFIKRQQLMLGPNDRWVTFSELLSGKDKEGVRIADGHIRELDKKLHGGLQGLPLSLDEVQSRAIKEIVRERKWELSGLAIGIVGTILTILFFILGGHA